MIGLTSMASEAVGGQKPLRTSTSLNAFLWPQLEWKIDLNSLRGCFEATERKAVWKSCEQNSRELEPFSEHKNSAYDRHFNCLFISRANSKIVQFSRVVTELVAFKSICPFWQPDKLLSEKSLANCCVNFLGKCFYLLCLIMKKLITWHLTGWWKKGLIDKSEEWETQGNT